MIRLTRLNGQQITVNSDLIKWVENNPDTVITLLNGEKLLVHESVGEVQAQVIEFRRSVLAGLFKVEADPGAAWPASANVQRDRTPLTPPEGSSRG